MLDLWTIFKTNIKINKDNSDNIIIDIPIKFSKYEFIKCLDLLELDDIMNYLSENYHLIEVEKKLNEIKELNNE